MASTIGALTPPLRYRGYVYDTETGFYYLQSRYYDPTTGRFINADDIDYLGADGTLLGYNLFTYCGNNPLLYSDPTGTFINTITGAIVGAIIGAASAAIAGDNVWAGMAIGAATGAFAGLAADIAIATGGVGAIAIAAVGGALSSGASYAATETVNGRQINLGELAVEMTVGAVANLLTVGAGDISAIKRGGKLFKNMAQDFTTNMMKGTMKNVGGKAVQRAKPIVKKIVTNNFLMATAETGTIAFGAWLNSNAWKGVLP